MIHMYKYLLLCLLLVRFCNAQANGILVDKPKVYDDYYLQSQLDSLKARLASLNALDQATLLGKIGGIQGSTLQQSSFSIQGMGPATPSVATSLPPAGVTPSGSNGTTTTTSALTPSGATPPPPTLSMPSTFAPSSLDALSEEMQLTSQIINLQLLLDGALNDRFIPGSQQPKRHITLGFSITVDPHLRNKRRLENRLAEVEITITNTPDLADATETPSVMTLLPREKTYNVASLVDNSFSLGGGGVIAGVFSVGAGWLWGKKTYYLVQQQDTLAIQRNTSTFAWQFRPVLNRKFVVSGTRQTFVQFSIPVGSPMKCSGQISIRTGWRKLDPKTGLASDLTDESPATLIEIPFFDLTPTAQAVDVTDIGGGMVSVRILGSYNQGLHFRIGSAILDQSTPGFSYSGDRINFIAAAKDIAAFGVIMIGRDGKENPISTAQQPPVLPPCAVPAAASSITRSYPPRSITPEAPAPSTHTLSSDEVGFNIAPTARVLQTAYPVLAASGPDPVSAEFTAKATAKPFSDSQSEVTITLENPPADFSKPGASLNPVVVLVGDQVFGLRNAPFRSRSETSITFLAPTDLLKSNRKLKVGQLLWGDGYVATAELALGTFPSNDF